MYYHIRISLKSSKARGESKVDLSEEDIKERFLKKYELGLPIIINGKTIPPGDIDRIQISKRSQASNQLIQQIKAKDRTTPRVFIGGPSYEWQAAGRADDITDELILGSPGYKQGEKMTPNESTAGPEKSTKKVFVVHGHNHALKSDAEVFLREIGLEPVVLHRQPDRGLTIIEKFEEYADVQFALVMLTPDDIGFSYDELKAPDEERVMQPRARQNVIFELGYFVGKLGRSNVFYIYQEGVEIPSDIKGLIYKKVNETIEEVGYALIKEFKTAGLDVIID